MGPFGDPVGSIFEVPGTLGQHLGSILAQWLPRPIPEPHLADLFDDFGHPLGSKWAAKATEGGPKVPKETPLEDLFEHISRKK